MTNFAFELNSSTLFYDRYTIYTYLAEEKEKISGNLFYD
jgi:hypothetical protein